MSMIKLVVFDLDGTLVDTRKAVRQVREQELTLKILREEGYQVKKEKLEKAMEEAEKEVDNYKGPKRFKPGFYQLSLFEELEYDISEEKAAKLDKKLFKEVLKNLELVPQATQILEYLNETKIPVFLLSNSPEEEMKQKVNKFDLAKYFDKMYSSQVTGTVKSGYAPFKKILDETDYSPKEILVVGNNPGEDALANEFGMKTAILLDYLETSGEGEQSRPDYELKNLMDIKDIIENN